MAVTARSEKSGFIRPDGVEKVTGLGRYTADLSFTGQAYAKFRYADHPHARLMRVDASRARAMPGVLAVLTHEDVPDVLYGVAAQDRRLFAKDKVRWEADVVAAVAATTPELAQQAADAIEVEYEPLPVQLDYVEAMEPGTPLVHDDWDSYTGRPELGRDGNVLGRSTIVKGDADAAMAEAHVVVRSRYLADPTHGVPIEPRAIVAEWQGDRVTVWSSTQVPFVARAGVARVLELPESHVRVVVPLLGGGFGSKCDFHFEGHVAALARAAGRPVKLVFSRREEFLAPDHRREGMVIELETGATREGELVARRGRLVLDNGAYCGEAGGFAQLAAMQACGPYRIANVDVEAFLNYTTTQPSGSIRAPTAPQVCWGLEQHMDEVAAALGLDPIELRRRTLVGEGDEGPTRQRFGPIGVRETLERAVEAIGYGEELPDDEAIGVSCGWWPSFPLESGAYVKLNADGTGTIVTGGQESGTGAVMGLPLLAAQVLGLEPEAFSLVYQDTAAAPWDMGASGSQTTLNSGLAVQAAAEEVAERLRELAAEHLEVAPEDLELREGAVVVRGVPSRRVAIEELTATGVTVIGKGAAGVREAPPCEAEACSGRLGLESFTAPCFFTHAVRIRVDRETGITRVLRVVAAHDSGTIINPIGAEGQVYGGVAMGIGMALTEGTLLDAEGRQRNASLLDYKLATVADMPEIDVIWVETPTENAGPNGGKGVGEPPCIGTPAAIGNAIAKIVGRHVGELPMTAERVWDAARG